MALGPIIRTCFRSGKAHPLRTALMIFGIGLGVAGVVAIDIAKTSVDKSFELSAAALTTRATHQVMGNDFTVPQSVFVQIRTELGIGKSAPVISRLVRLEQARGRTFTLMGVDPFSETHFRPLPDHLKTGKNQEHIRQVFNRGSGVIMDKSVALSLGLEAGDDLVLALGENKKEVTIGALMDLNEKAGFSGSAAFEGILLADISLAQEILEMGDRITRIDLALGSPQEASQVSGLLKQGLVLVETGSRNQTIRGLSASFEASLTAFSMLVLFMGLFLIYNTVSFSMARRRKLNGIFRALGAGKRDIFLAVLTEVMTYALAGSALGIVLGIAMGKGAVHAVCATVSDMYYTLTVNQTHITFLTLVKGAGVGIAATLLSSVIPALDAAGSPPVTLMQASTPHSTLARAKAWLALAGVLTMAFSLMFFTWEGPGTDLVFFGIFVAFAGASLVCPALISSMSRLMVRAVKRLERAGFSGSPATALMGIRNLDRSLSGTSVLIASLMVVISVYIGIDTMTRSFRISIEEWVDGHIGGDIHISSLDELNPGLLPGVLARLENQDQVKAVSAYNIHKSFSSRSGEIHVFSFIKDLSLKKWTWLAPEAGKKGSGVDGLMDHGWVLVSEIFARQHGLSLKPDKASFTLTMDTLQGEKRFPVAGIFRDFFMGGGRAVVSRKLMKDYWGKDEITAVQVFVTGRNPHEKNKIVKEMTNTFQEHNFGSGLLRIRSGTGIKQSILAVFDKTFLITTALQFLTALVALTGIVNSIMALILGRSRELAVLRACGAEAIQVRGLILWESGACGFMAGLFALPLGILLSWVLVDVINFKAFGWTYEIRLSWVTMAQAMGFSFLAALGSGLIPAVRALKIPVPVALRNE